MSTEVRTDNAPSLPGHYHVPGICDNCWRRASLQVERGVLADVALLENGRHRRFECPNCGCQKVRRV